MRPTFEVDARRVRVELDGEPHWGRLDADSIVLDGGREIAETEARYLAPVEPTKILAVHLTYRSRVEEYAARTPPEPSYFVKPPTTLNGHRRPIGMARGARFLNYEGELAVVVGKRMKGVAIDDALSYVAGYTCLNDVTARDLQFGDGQWTRGKSLDTFCPMGPVLVTSDELVGRYAGNVLKV